MSSIGANRDAINFGNAIANSIVINSGDHFHNATPSENRAVTRDVFQPSFQVPANPREVVLDFGNPFNPTQPQTQEAILLHELLRKDYDQSETRVIAVHGKGGVGKSCILRALAGDENVKERFPDGVYFLSLGMDANTGTVIQGLIEIAHLSGGRELARELHGELNLRVALQKMGEWLRGKECLLLVDDFWEENGLGADVVTELAQVLSKKSVLVVSTRFSAVATKGTEMEVKPLGTTSEEAKRMLLRYSKFDWREVEKGKAVPAFDKLLRMCGGLPIFLAIVGKAVAKIALRFMHKSERTSAWEECLWMMEDSEMLETSVEGYKGLGRTLHMSLKLLSEDCGELFRELSPYSLHEMHRAFCVFKKQAAIPISVCRRLWKVESDSAAFRIGLAFADVGLADVEIERKGDKQVKIVRLHDLVQIFAVKCAKAKGELMGWHGRLLEGYISQAGGRESVRRWWEVDKTSGGDYLFEHLCRHLAGSGNIEELAGLLLRGEWTKFRHEHGGLSAWKHDCSAYLRCKTIVAVSERGKKIENGVRMTRDAVAESWAVVHRNIHELGFQMFGRLVDCKNEFIVKYLESIARVQHGPWLKPMQRLWTRPGEGGMIVEFDLGYGIWDIVAHKDPLIAAVAVGKEVVIIDLKEMTVKRKCSGHTEEVKKVGISADGKRVLSWSDDCTIWQWDLESGKQAADKFVRVDAEGSDEDDRVTCTAFSSDMRFVTTGSRKGKVKIWDLYRGERIGRTIDTTKSVTCIEVSPNGRIIAVGLDGGAVLLWDLQIFKSLGGELKGHLSKVSNIAFSSDGQLVASSGSNLSGAEDHAVRLWNIESRAQIGDPFVHCEHYAYSIMFSENGQHIIAGHFGGWITVWDVANGAAIRSWKAHSGCVLCCVTATSHDGSQYAVSRGGDRVVRVWDLRTLPNLGSDECTWHDGVVECIAASPNGRFLVSASRDKTLRIWNAVDGTALTGALCGHEGIVTCVAVSPDSRRLVSGSQDSTMRVWEATTGAHVGDALRGHKGWVECVAYNENGRFVVSGSDDCTARLWGVIDNPEVDEGICEPSSKRVRIAEPGVRRVLSNWEPLHLEMILQHGLPGEGRNRGYRVRSVTMSPDGQRVLSGLFNGEIWVWDTRTRNCIYRAQSGNRIGIARIEFSKKNEVTTTNLFCEELRWQLDDEEGLIRVLENENVNGIAKAEAHEGSACDGLNSVLCFRRSVYLRSSGRQIALLPGAVWPTAWKYDAERRVLCTGLKDGRVFLFRVEC